MHNLNSKVNKDLEGPNANRLSKIVGYLVEAFYSLRQAKLTKYNRVLPFAELITDRWEKAQLCGFGQGTSAYDSVLVMGNVEVGENTWIGPNVILDGSGGLKIGSNCSLSANVQIYTHDTVKWATSGGEADYEYAPTSIGDNCYIGPNTVIQRGITIGKGVVIGANSLVNKDISDGAKAWGTPAKIHPPIKAKLP